MEMTVKEEEITAVGSAASGGVPEKNYTGTSTKCSTAENLNESHAFSAKPVLSLDKSRPDLLDNADEKTREIITFLKEKNLKGTFETFVREAFVDTSDAERPATGSISTSNKQSADNVPFSDVAGPAQDARSYARSYMTYQRLIHNALDSFKSELAQLNYPFFVHIYLTLVHSDHVEEAQVFMEEFRGTQETYLQPEIDKLSQVRNKAHFGGCSVISQFWGSAKYVVRMCRDTYAYLKRHADDKLLNEIIETRLRFDLTDGEPRTRDQIHSSAGGYGGACLSQLNRSKILYGLLKEPDITAHDEEEEDDDGKSKGKKKVKRDGGAGAKKAKVDPNAPTLTRIPIPELRDIDKLDRALARRAAMRRVKLGPHRLPSICEYTLSNVDLAHPCCVAISEDSTMLSVGFSEGTIRVWTLVQNKLRSLKTAEELQQVDKNASDVYERMLDNKTAEDCKELIGHDAAVARISFNNDKTLLASGDHDGKIRLWSLQTFSCVYNYRFVLHPIWDVAFAPHGYYYAVASGDGIVRVWGTDHYHPLRMFCGHLSDVLCCVFHPNTNYVASGSADNTVRVWDMHRGACVRHFSGHKSRVTCLAFHPQGRYLASGSADCTVLLFDLGGGCQLARFSKHAQTVNSLSFSREGVVLASGSSDQSICVWDVADVTRSAVTSGGEDTAANPTLISKPIQQYWTSESHVVLLHFTRRNLLIACSIYQGSSEQR